MGDVGGGVAEFRLMTVSLSVLLRRRMFSRIEVDWGASLGGVRVTRTGVGS